jgi:hypothetical protein
MPASITVVTTITGVVLIAFVLLEIFRDLFQPSGSGALSNWIARGMFQIARRLHRLLPSSGPLAVLITICCWTAMLMVGFALLYWPWFPVGFTGPERVDGSGISKIWAVLYYSLGAMTTLGAGQISPRIEWIRMVAAIESLLGFSLVTASVSWIVLLYPALGRMRRLARETRILVDSQKATGIEITSGQADQLLTQLATDVIQTRVDLIHYPLIYFFHADVERAALPNSLAELYELASGGSEENHPATVRLGSTMLRSALDELAKLLSDKFVDEDAERPVEVFRAFAQDHLTTEKSGGSEN